MTSSPSGMSVLCMVSCCFAVLLFIGNLIKRKKSHANILFAFLMADVAAALGLSAWHYAADPAMSTSPRNSLSLLSLSGIMVYLLFQALARPSTARKRSHLLPFLLMIPSVLTDSLNHIFRLGESSNHALSAFIQAMHIGIVLIVFLLYAGSFTHVFKLYTPRTMTRTAWSILVVSVIAAISLLSGLSGVILADMKYFAVMDCFISVTVFAIAILDFRYPDALGLFHEETVKRRYARSLLSGLDIDGLKTGMIEMMEKSKAYLDESFNLDMLSQRMGLSAHQVSELLNDRMGTNFSNFINGFRIEAAKKLLASQPEMTMLAIAMEVGFGNKTSFNEAFKRRIRSTPRQYRETFSKTSQER